jgi:Fe-S cluster biogenesis protein NfuA
MRFLVVERSETPNPDSLRFFSMELSFLSPGQTLDMPNSGHAYKSPLAEALFSIDGVLGLYFADEYITVTKDSAADWAALAPLVQEGIIAFAKSGKNILSDEGKNEVASGNADTDPRDYDDDVVLAVKELIATRIRPMLNQDGGNIRYVGMDDGTVFVMLEGACKSCPSSGMTLKHGIERMLMHWIPEVVEVVEVDPEFALDWLSLQQKERDEKRAGISSPSLATGCGESQAPQDNIIPPK